MLVLQVMARLTQLFIVATVLGISADFLDAHHSEIFRIGLIGTGSKHSSSLGPLASTAALEPLLVSASQHAEGLAVQASVAKQAPRDPHPNYQAPRDKNATVRVGANGAGFVGSGRAPKMKRAPAGVSAPQPPSVPEPPTPPSVEDLTPEVPELPKVPSVPDLSPALPDPPKHAVPQEWGQRKCFYLLILLLCFCGCFGVVAQQEHGLHVGSAAAMTPAFLLLGYMFTQTDVMSRFWRGEQVGWWCAALCFWASLQLLFGLGVLVAVGAGAASARKQLAAEAQAVSQP